MTRLVSSVCSPQLKVLKICQSVELEGSASLLNLKDLPVC